MQSLEKDAADDTRSIREMRGDEEPSKREIEKDPSRHPIEMHRREAGLIGTRRRLVKAISCTATAARTLLPHLLSALLLLV